jgi:hypothetical protein
LKVGGLWSRVLGFDLGDDKRPALIELLRRTINEAGYPLSPSLAPLPVILAKLDPRPELSSPLKACDAPSSVRRRRRQSKATGRG